MLDNGEPREVYVPGEVDWCSTEHNIDAFFFLRDLIELTGKPGYRLALDRVQNALLRSFNDRLGQFNRGVSPREWDELMALDAASWGALFLMAVGEDGQARRAMSTVEQYRNTSSGVAGV